MGKRWALVLGWLWPFVVAVVGIGVVATGHRPNDTEAGLLLTAGLLGVPAIPPVVWERLPARWPEGWRFATAMLLTGPILVAELYLAITLFAVGSSWTGYGWIE
jgi:hypothetical protein